MYLHVAIFYYSYYVPRIACAEFANLGCPHKNAA